MNILITGYPRTGKTTLIKKLLEKLEATRAGFYTEELCKNNRQRVGFQIKTIKTKQTGLLAHVAIKSNWQVGRYYVQLPEFERLVIPELQITADVIVIDEIGKMELLSEPFREQLLKNLAKGNVLATITKKGGGKFVQQIKERPDVQLLEITIKNRDALLPLILKMLYKGRKNNDREKEHQ